jgi:hypothetical protein
VDLRRVRGNAGNSDGVGITIAALILDCGSSGNAEAKAATAAIAASVNSRLPFLGKAD